MPQYRGHRSNGILDRSFKTCLYDRDRNFHEFSSLPIKVPTACARFHNDLVWQPEFILKDIYHNLLQITDYEQGGHFAALEHPQLLSDDIWSAVKKFEAYNQNK